MDSFTRKRINAALQCPECYSVQIVPRLSRFQAQAEGYQCNECGCQFQLNSVPVIDYQSAEAGYEYDNIQNKLNQMTEVQLNSAEAHRLMDCAAQIRQAWRR